MLKKKCLPTRVVASSLAALILLSTAGSNIMTIKASAAETATETRFIPFRSSIVPYIIEHSGDKGQEIIDEWLRIWAEQSTYAGGASAWANKYYSAYMGAGGEFVSDSQAKGRTFIYNKEFDSYLANTIKANGLDFMNQWLNAKGTVAATGGNFSGETVFINYFNGTAYKDYTNTSLAIISLTQTPEGKAWLQNYSYEKTGNKEASVGVGLLKLLTLNWKKLDDDQIEWCKEYLPYLLMNYRDYGANAIAAYNSESEDNTLYDFMARSVNGAQCTYTSKVSKKVMQQEFYDYVVASGKGYGEFVQNIIGGGTYTAVTPDRTISDVDLKNISMANTIFVGDADADYTATSAGDGDYDWFCHGLWLSSAAGASAGKQAQNSQFVTLYNLIQNSGAIIPGTTNTTRDLYSRWVSLFNGINERTSEWNHLTEYNATYSRPQVGDLSTGALYAFSMAGGHYFDYFVSNGEGNGIAVAQGTQLAGAYYSMTGYNSRAYSNLNTGQNGMWRDTQDYDVRYSGTVWPDNVIKYTPPLDYGAGTVSVSFGCQVSAGSVIVQICDAKYNSIGIQASTTSTGTATVSIPESKWKQYGNLYLKIIYNPKPIFDTWYKGTTVNGPEYFSFTINSVTESWTGAQECIHGHDWNIWSDNRDSVFNNWNTKNAANAENYELIVSRTCKRDSAHMESEVITPKVTYDAKKYCYIYTYEPKYISHDIIVIEKFVDIGTGTVVYDKNKLTSSQYGGVWRVDNNNYLVQHTHPYYNGTWYSRTLSTADAEGRLSVKQGVIKSNVKTITVDLVQSGTVVLYDKNDNKLAIQSGNGIITLDVSSVPTSNKEGCYLLVHYYNTNSIYVDAIYQNVANGWTTFPDAKPVSVSTLVNNITIKY